MGKHALTMYEVSIKWAPSLSNGDSRNPDDPAHENFNLCFDHNYLKELLKTVYSSCMHLL